MCEKMFALTRTEEAERPFITLSSCEPFDSLAASVRSGRTTSSTITIGMLCEGALVMYVPFYKEREKNEKEA
jgi:hypothetical protein